MLTVPELRALAVCLELPMGGRAGGNRDAILGWYRRTVIPPPGSFVVRSALASSPLAVL